MCKKLFNGTNALRSRYLNTEYMRNEAHIIIIECRMSEQLRNHFAIQNSCCQIKCSSFVWSAIVVQFAGKFLLVVLFAYYLPLTVFKFTLRFSYTFCRFLLSVMSSVMFMEFEPFWLRIFNTLYAFLVTELSHSVEFQWKFTQKPTRTSDGKYFHTYSVPFGARSTWNSHRLFEC